jgi:predicted aldo/keto reductase-like oxidoreductase
MLYRRIGRTGESASILGFGCMRFPVIDDKAHQIDEKRATAMIEYAVDHGVDYFDTAYPYHKSNRSPKGRSEPFVGKVLKRYPRDDIKIATKLPSWLVKSRKDMDEYLDDQLKRLRTDYVDFYLLHGLNTAFWKNLTNHNVLDFLDGALSDGRIRHAGFSFHDELPLFKEIIDAYDWGFCQMQYNYMDEENQAGTKGLKYAAKKGLGVIIMEPLLGGFLGNKLPRDIRAKLNRAKPKRTPAELALRFLWDKPEISVVLSGMTTMPQLRENVKIADAAGARCLSKGEKMLIERNRKGLRSKSRVMCTGCRYCMPCPSGVDIPACFEQLNHGHMYDDIPYAKRAYAWSVKPESMASKCNECGRCEELCPQNVMIRDRLKDVVRELEV